MHGTTRDTRDILPRLLDFCLLLFLLTCVFDPADKVLNLKVYIFALCWVVTLTICLSSRDPVAVPRGLLIYTLLFILVPLYSIVWHWLSDGSPRFEGFSMLKGYVLITLAPMLVLARTDLLPRLCAVSGMRYRRFFGWDALGVVTQVASGILIGFLAGGSYQLAAELFARGCITNEGYPGEITGAEAVADLYRTTNRVHDDGTLRTRHLTTNVIVDVDDAGDAAAARSAFVVLQATPDLPLQPIVTGRYHDRFGRADGAWHFVERHMLLDHVGDVSRHLHPGLVARLHADP